MRKKLLSGLLLLMTTLLCGANENYLGYTARVQLQVINIDKTQEEIIKFLNENKLGYFTNRDNQYMQLKIRINTLEGKELARFMDKIKDFGLIVSKEQQNVNYRDQINKFDVIIKTQEDTLSKIFQVFDKAGLFEALDIEKKIQEIIEEIENAKGQLRYIQEHIQYAYVDISFKSYSSLITGNVSSPFGWINQLRIENLFSGVKE